MYIVSKCFSGLIHCAVNKESLCRYLLHWSGVASTRRAILTATSVMLPGNAHLSMCEKPWGQKQSVRQLSRGWDRWINSSTEGRTVLCSHIFGHTYTYTVTYIIVHYRMPVPRMSKCAFKWTRSYLCELICYEQNSKTESESWSYDLILAHILTWVFLRNFWKLNE